MALRAQSADASAILLTLSASEFQPDFRNWTVKSANIRFLANGGYVGTAARAVIANSECQRAVTSVFHDVPEAVLPGCRRILWRTNIITASKN